MPAKWVVGQMARLTVEVTDIADAPTDPSLLRFKIKTPAGVVSTFAWPGAPELERTGVGVFYTDIPLLEPGVYAFRFESDGVLMGAGERTLTVAKSLIG
ncbi:hypothetical protein [Azonexus sp.]|jgi:hypothetical protein|uniref:hypothetical protein n=1 Tax=Azonexus sp. TaxID=1872668 RepID=UPI00283A4991|nr:hypothetical protein [Azonexus sp.]MDR1995150.1 hypothetical protein [Azonexus sp.]